MKNLTKLCLTGLTALSSFTSLQAQQMPICNVMEYQTQMSTLNSIWLNTYQDNCMNADQFLATFGRPIQGVSSCSISSRNQATIAFARSIKQRCVQGCEAAGKQIGEQFGLQVAASVCQIAPSRIYSTQVACETRVANFCILGLQDQVSRLCPQAIGSLQYQQAVQSCINWAQ